MVRIMPHLCGNTSLIHGARRNNAAGSIAAVMQERQKSIAEWMQQMMERHEISARAWAESAKLGKDTVSRAVRPDYQHVTSTTTIAKLADALEERPPGLAAAVPSVASLHGVLQVLLKAIPGAVPVADDVSLALAEGLRDTLLHLADEPEAMGDPKLSTALARASARQLRQRHA